MVFKLYTPCDGWRLKALKPINMLNCCVFGALNIYKYKMCVMTYCKPASVIFWISSEFLKPKGCIRPLKDINAYRLSTVIDGQNNFEFVFHLLKIPRQLATIRQRVLN
jgi:hypothetical protein